MAPATLPATDDKEWPVQLYRYTECDGWQKQTGAKTAAAPRKDCIVIPCLRQKFSLLANGEKTYVIRRDRCMLMVSRRRTRALVLQFPSLQECLDFSDAFLALNPAHEPTQEDTTVSPPEAGLADQEEVVSYIARILHDKDFLGFVHKIETYLSNTTDGTKLLESLGKRKLDDITEE
jgi:hypothetical protein